MFGTRLYYEPSSDSFFDTPNMLLQGCGPKKPAIVAEQSTTTSEQLGKSDQAKDFTRPNTFTSGIEGPAVSIDGSLYLVNYEKEGTIGKVNSDGESELFLELPIGSIGNGIRFDSNGQMLIADYPQHNVLRVDMATKQIDTLAHQPQMNQPNDLAITSTDIIFASDPNWSESTGNLWRIDPDGSSTLLEANMGTTNGVEVSPDEKTLYVNESVQRNVWAYDLSIDGDISNKRLLLQFPDFGMDGMRCDNQGNLYITRYGKGSVAIVSPEGKILREVQTDGKNTSNIAFGGDDGKTCYITLQDRGMVESFQAEFPGRAWELVNRKSTQLKE